MIGRFIRDESAATMIEYALIAAMISLVALAGAGSISDILQEGHENAATRLQEARQQ